jgi:hypothetical protein
MMASELAESICTAYFNSSEGALLRNVVDVELQGVREVLDGLIQYVFDEGDGRGPQPHWCDPDDNTTPDCTPACQRARQLAERLRVG